MENFEQGYGRKNKLWQVEVLVDDVFFKAVKVQLLY